MHLGQCLGNNWLLHTGGARQDPRWWGHLEGRARPSCRPLRVPLRCLGKANLSTCLSPMPNSAPQQSSWATVSAGLLALCCFHLGSECPACPSAELSPWLPACGVYVPETLSAADIDELGELRQLSFLLWASVSSCVSWGNDRALS